MINLENKEGRHLVGLVKEHLGQTGIKFPKNSRQWFEDERAKFNDRQGRALKYEDALLIYDRAVRELVSEHLRGLLGF